MSKLDALNAVEFHRFSHGVLRWGSFSIGMVGQGKIWCAGMKHIFVLALFLTGCSYTHKFGEIGPYQLHKVQIGSIAGPSQTLFATINTNTGEVVFSTPLGGNGVIGAVMSGSGQAAAGWFIGRGLEKGDFSSDTHVNQSSAAEASSAADSISSPTVIVPDPPPAPMLPRIRPPFGRARGFDK